jgi:serine phosphatase RsbU (regulator of sigma subunit)
VLWLLAGFLILLAAVAVTALATGSTGAMLLWLLYVLWAAGTAAMVFWYLWRWLTYRVSVRLAISYLLLGVTPFVVCLALGGFAVYMAMGQYTSVRFGTELERLHADLLDDCRHIMTVYRTSGQEAAAEVFGEVAERPRHLAPRVLWTARLGNLSLASPGAEGLPELSWVTGDTATLSVAENDAFLVAGTRGDVAPNLVTAVVPLDAQMARTVIAARWYDVFFTVLEEEMDDLQDRGGMTVSTNLGEGASVRFHEQDIPVEEVWQTWPESERGLLHRPWVYWFRLDIETRRLVDGEPGGAIICLLRTSPMKVATDFTSSKYELGASLWGALVALAIVLLSLYGLALVIAATMIASISRSTSRLTKGAKAVEKGRLDHRIPVKRHDQLGDLAASFNRMTQSVQDMLADVAEKERLAKELELAREIQESLLPDRHLRHGELSVHAIFRPAAAVGGDYFDIFPLGEGRLLVVVGDVAGHGLHAGLLMASLKSTVAALVHEGYSGADLVSRVNALVLGAAADPTMATLCVVDIDTESDTLNLANAGHPPAYLIHDGRSEELLVSSLPLGTSLAKPGSIDRPFPAGARILLYSDGLVEATDATGEPFTYERLATVVADGASMTGGELETSILAALDRVTEGAPLADDLTLLVVERGVGSQPVL